MPNEKTLLSGNTTLLILKLLEVKDMYGYQIIEELSCQSCNVFNLKTGTLYPLLHMLENDGIVTSYEGKADSGMARKYYRITSKGTGLLAKRRDEWKTYSDAVNKVLNGGAGYAFI